MVNEPTTTTQIVIPDIISDREDENFNHKIIYQGETYWVDAADLMKRIKSLNKTLNTGFLDLARYLFYIATFKLYKIWGLDNFKNFCSDIIDINHRTAQYYINIYSILIEEMGVTKEKIIEIGWSKSKEIVRLILKKIIVDRADLTQWLTDAGSMNLKDFEKKVTNTIRELNGQDQLPEFEKYTFKVRKEDAPFVQKAINLSKKMLKTKDGQTAQNASLAFMAQEWITQHGEEGDFLLMIRRMESNFHCNITIEREGTIVYPSNALETGEPSQLPEDFDEYSEPEGLAIKDINENIPSNKTVIETEVIPTTIEEQNEGFDNVEEIDEAIDNSEYEEYEEYTG